MSLRPLLSLAILGILAWTPWARSQEANELSAQDKQRLAALSSGKEAPTGGDKGLLERAAKFQLNRLRQEKYQNKLPPENRSLDDLLENETFKSIPLPAPQKPLSDNQQKYMEAFTSAYLGPIDEALHNSKPIVRVNAARILARIADSGQEQAAEEILKVLKDKDQIDAVKFWAVHGLGNLFAVLYADAAIPGNERPNRRAFKKGNKAEELEDQCITALVEFVIRKSTLPPNATSEEEEAFRYVRREGIRALAQTRLPAVMNKKEFVGTPTALAFLKVLVNDGITPTASIPEQVEAAIGVCQLQTNLTDGYQPDYAAHVVGQFLVELAKAFNNKPAPGAIADYPWKVYAARLMAALAAWKEANASDKYISAVVEHFDTMLRTVQKSQGLATFQSLQDWLKKPAPHDSLFKGHPEMVVKSGEGE
jgi:PBS lyase HEAT-like repeat